MKTEVCITIDTEFDIAGTFTNPARFAPVAESNVWCGDGRRSHGLGFLLSTFAEHGVRATFFVEALNTCYFGDEPMRRVVQEIIRSGHDAQLHLHPVWTYFRDPKWREQLAITPPNDSVVGREQREIEALIDLGLATFSRWELPRPIALRTGGLHVDQTVFRAMKARRMLIGSNIGVAVYRPAATVLQRYGGVCRVNGVTEIPVLTYRRSGLPRQMADKTLTITGTSWGEMKQLLWAARQARIGPVVILSHAHEYARARATGAWYPNRMNQRRLVQLCAFLARERDDFDVVTFAQRERIWCQRPESENVQLRVGMVHGLRGLAENLYNDWVVPAGMWTKSRASAKSRATDELPTS
jgi:hypothetical protein